MKYWIPILLMVLLMASCDAQSAKESKTEKPSTAVNLTKINRSEAEWKKQLTDEEYYILREKGTERAFTGKYVYNKDSGTYVCAGCQLPLFSSATKFKSGTGWPSFYEPIVKGHVAEEQDMSYGMVRTEIHCARCGGHLGHVFRDGPPPTGLRYCINGYAMDFEKAGEKEH